MDQYYYECKDPAAKRGDWEIAGLKEDKAAGSTYSCLQRILSDITIVLCMETQAS